MSNHKDKSKLAQLVHCLKSTHAPEIALKILEKEGDLNYRLSINRNLSKNYSGCTALHFTLMENKIDVFNMLLEHGADFTLKDSNGETILTKLKNLYQQKNNLFIISVLGMHVKANISYNPANKHGLSHFHIACIVNNLKAVEFFLRNKVAIDDAVNFDSTFSPGYTALHFAAKSNNSRLAKILLQHGANFNILNARKMTALHVLIENRIELFNSLRLAIDQDTFEKLQHKITENEKIINMMMENFSDSNSEDSIGMSNFHIACMLQDFSVVENIFNGAPDINQAINIDSHLWAGYTALHFAAHSSVEMVHFLIGLGANLEAKDAKKSTPLDICIRKYEVKEIKKLIESQKKWKNVAFSDEKIELIDFISVLQNQTLFKDLIKASTKNWPYAMSIPHDSPLWPGFTLLHLVVLFAKKSEEIKSPSHRQERDLFFKIIEQCLENGADLMAQNRLGQTPLHLAFRLGKTNILELFFRLSLKITDSVDDENLSHLHIMTTFNKPYVLDILDTENSDVNIAYNGSIPIGTVEPGFTALHVALNYQENYDPKDSSSVIRILLKRGANCHKADVHGLTPIHWLLSFPQAVAAYLARFLLKDLENLVATKHNLSYLHVASFCNYKTAVAHLLKKRVDVNMSINVREPKDNDPLWFLTAHSELTPLYISSDYFNIDIPALLIQYDADVLFKNNNGQYLPLNSGIFRAFLECLKDNKEFQQNMEAKLGLTKLHLACEELSFRRARSMLDAGANINAQIDLSSPIWAGYTPLHVLMTKAKTAANFKPRSRLYGVITNILVLLLKKGADVTIRNQKQESPIDVFFRFYMNNKEHEIINLLMQHITNFTVNPVNEQGISHFHMACHLNSIAVIEQFLENGNCIHQPIDFFSDAFAGASCLHLTSQQEIIKLLLDSGCNVHAQDAYGNTPLHKVAERFPFNPTVFDKFIESGADISAQNIYGQTPFEILLLRTTVSFEDVEYFLKYGCLVSARNPINKIAYLSTVISTKYTSNCFRNQFIERVLAAPEMRNDALNHSLLHDIVSMAKSTLKVDDYTILIKKLIECGYDIDTQDHEGKTALSVSVTYGNEAGVAALLMCGADINITDALGKTALSYLTSIEYTHRSSNFRIKKLIINHVHKMELLKLELIYTNRECYNAMKRIHSSDIVDEAKFLEHVDQLKNFELNSIRLQEFLSYHGIVIVYSLETKSRRRILIDEFVKLIDNDNRFYLIKDIIYLQYRKAIKRSELIFLAEQHTNILFGFDFPYLCNQALFQFLTNVELQNLIDASNKIEDDTI